MRRKSLRLRRIKDKMRKFKHFRYGAGLWKAHPARERRRRRRGGGRRKNSVVSAVAKGPFGVKKAKDS